MVSIIFISKQNKIFSDPVFKLCKVNSVLNFLLLFEIDVFPQKVCAWFLVALKCKLKKTKQNKPLSFQMMKKALTILNGQLILC